MANILLGEEEKTTLVLVNTCVAFALLAAYSPETSRPYLLATATALGLFSLYPIYFILQRPRRFMVARETEGDKSVFVLRYKGYLWWYDAKDRKGNAIFFNTLEDAQTYIRENVVTALISDRMRRKSLKREIEVIMDSKKMNQDTEAPLTESNQGGQQQRQEASPTPQPDAAQQKEEEREEIIPDNQAAIANLFAMGKANHDGNKEEEDENEETQKQKSEAKENKGFSLLKQPTDKSSEKEAPSEPKNETEYGNENEEDEQDDTDDPFASDYPAPVDDTEDARDDVQDDGYDGPADPIDAESFNEQLFDVIDNFNKSANHKKPSSKPEHRAPAPEVNTQKAEPQKETMVTTAQVAEDQALVHAHKAETVKDALSKILFHQQMVEQNEEKKRAAETKTTIIPARPETKIIPKSRRNKEKSPDGIPTKNIQYRPSAEEKVLQKRQMTLLEMPGFIEPEDNPRDGDGVAPEDQQAVKEDAQHQATPESDTTENDGSSGGPRVVKKLPDEDPAPSPAITDEPAAQDNTVPESQDTVFTNGSETQEEEPQDDDNGTLQL